MLIQQPAAGSFYTKKLGSRLYSIEVDFYSKNEKNRLWATLRELRCNVRTPSVARWKARDRLPIRHNWTVFATSYGWDVMSGNLSKSAFLKGVTLSTNFRPKGHPPTTVGVKKLEGLPLPLCGIKISAVHCLVLSQSTRVTDKGTDRQAELRQLIPS